jgi:RNA polymerase sigma-70 factor (sigma-E family)
MLLIPLSRDPQVGASSRPAEDEIDLEQLFHDEWLRLVRLAVLLTDDRGTAEELVQEAFLLMHKASGRIRDPKTAPAYLRTTVVNLARSRLRRVRIVRRTAPPLDVAVSSPEDSLVLREDHREVLAALALLPRRQRECVVLRYYLDLSEAEIARTLGISTGSVKSHSHRALAALESTLEAHR